MKKPVYDALQKSIQKWERNARVKKFDRALVDAEDCPLCHLFMLRSPMSNCNGCPIKEATGLEGCNSTPYDEASDTYDEWNYAHPDEELRLKSAKNFRAAAEKEVLFLKAIRPFGGPED